MKKILVLGKNGYISRCFQEYISSFNTYDVKTISVRDQTWKELDFSRYDSVFNATGLAHNDARKGTDAEFMHLNVELPYMLAKKAKDDGVRQFINMSSMIVYGEIKPLGDNERIGISTIPEPTNIYGMSKLLGEEKLTSLNDDVFKVAVIRSSLVYGENAVDNFQRLVDYAFKLRLFPNVNNERSMIYSDNLCELIRLIIESNGEGFYYPQQEQYICTSQLVKDIADFAGHKLKLVRIFNPILRMLSGKVSVVDKAFGSEAYEMVMSNAFDGKYRVVSYADSVRRIAGSRRNI